MDKPISSIMTKNVATVNLKDSIAQVEDKLKLRKYSCAPVIDMNGVCFGIISATDLMHFHTQWKNLRAEKAWEVCTHKVIEVTPDTSIKKVAQLMVEHKIHHVLVTENKSIQGIVSSIDLIQKYLLKDSA